MKNIRMLKRLRNKSLQNTISHVLETHLAFTFFPRTLHLLYFAFASFLLFQLFDCCYESRPLYFASLCFQHRPLGGERDAERSPVKPVSMNGNSFSK